MELLVTTKDPETKTKAFEKCLDVIKGAGVGSTRNKLSRIEDVQSLNLDQQKKVGTLPKDTATGPFADDWKRAFGDISKDVEEVDITPALSAAFAVKDPEELVSIRMSCAQQK